jgi:hypothetical protein
MKPRSAQKKGKRAEEETCRRIERMGLGNARRTAGSGNGNRDKGDIIANLPFMIEVKNQKIVHFIDWVAQSKEQALKGHIDPNKWCLLVIDPKGVQEGDRMEIYATIEFDEFLELLKRNKSPKVKEPDKLLTYQLNQLKEIFRRLENDPLSNYEYGRAKKLCSDISKSLEL